MVIFVVWSVAACSGQDVRMNIFYRKGGANKRLPYPLTKKVASSSAGDCASTCEQNGDCESFNIGPVQSDGKLPCELNDQTQAVAGLELQTEENWAYYDGVSFTDFNPICIIVARQIVIMFNS